MSVYRVTTPTVDIAVEADSASIDMTSLTLFKDGKEVAAFMYWSHYVVDCDAAAISHHKGYAMPARRMAAPPI